LHTCHLPTLAVPPSSHPPHPILLTTLTTLTTITTSQHHNITTFTTSSEHPTPAILLRRSYITCIAIIFVCADTGSTQRLCVYVCARASAKRSFLRPSYPMRPCVAHPTLMPSTPLRCRLLSSTRPPTTIDRTARSKGDVDDAEIPCAKDSPRPSGPDDGTAETP
jgi:hypothetical protein